MWGWETGTVYLYGHKAAKFFLYPKLRLELIIMVDLVGNDYFKTAIIWCLTENFNVLCSAVHLAACSALGFRLCFHGAYFIVLEWCDLLLFEDHLFFFCLNILMWSIIWCFTQESYSWCDMLSLRLEGLCFSSLLALSPLSLLSWMPFRFKCRPYHFSYFRAFNFNCFLAATSSHSLEVESLSLVLTSYWFFYSHDLTLLRGKRRISLAV